MDSEKAWGTGWAAATDEWQAAQALGANDSVSKATREEISSRGKPLSDTDLSAFRERGSLLQTSLADEHPSGEVELYRGIKGAQAKKLGGEVGGEVELGVHGLSSWSTSRSVAAEFSGKSGRILSTTVKIKDVWSTGEHIMAHQIIRFSDQHGEYVIKTSGKTRAARVVR
jgi:hypothetical protein